MARQPESILKEKVLADLRQLPNSYATKIQQVAIRGTPDILACIVGRFIALELKRDDKQKAEPLQLHELNKVEGAGGIALVVTPLNWQSIYDTLAKMAYLAMAVPKRKKRKKKSPQVAKKAQKKVPPKGDF